MKAIIDRAGRLLDENQVFVLATIVSRHGSTPRTAGVRMIVEAAGRTWGTIGGGLMEARVVEQAAAVLASQRPQIMVFDMRQIELADMDLICGGRLEVLLERIAPGSDAAAAIGRWRDLQRAGESGLFLTVLHFTAEKLDAVDHCLLQGAQTPSGAHRLAPATIDEIRRSHAGAAGLRTLTIGEALVLVEPVCPVEVLHLFGAGHVAQPTARLAAFAGFRVWVADDRAAFANAARFPEAEAVRVLPSFDAALDGVAIDRRAFIVIVTRGHLHDRAVLAQALRTEACYIGMIGSRRKRDQIFRALRKQGVGEDELKRVHAPIGLDIGAETPAEIAFSIVAELIQVRAQGRRK
jgi:xanthine dehydrogenase accessory factor